MQRINAFYTLAMALLRNVLTRPFVTAPRCAPWLAQLHEEHLGPVPAAAWPHLARTSRCIGCGLCDVAGDLNSDSDTGVADLVMGAGRQPADAPVELDRAARLRRLAPEIARVCPARMATEALAVVIEANAEMLAGHGNRTLAAGESRRPFRGA